MWLGLPVVTLLGDRHVSRVSASLVTAVGHPEWVARSEDDYVRIATSLAGDLPRLSEVRQGLRAQMAASAILDHSGQAERFGNALRSCWQAWCDRA